MGHLKTLPLIKGMDLIYAKVPIMRATFHPPFDKIVIDLNANNAVAIRNTHLLCFYSGCKFHFTLLFWFRFEMTTIFIILVDWRIRPLVCAIKEWAKKRGINNASQSSLTSYSLVLMAIHYLQCGVTPAIVPSLQHQYHERFDAHLDVRDLDSKLIFLLYLFLHSIFSLAAVEQDSRLEVWQKHDVRWRPFGWLLSLLCLRFQVGYFPSNCFILIESFQFWQVRDQCSIGQGGGSSIRCQSAAPISASP